MTAIQQVQQNHIGLPLQVYFKDSDGNAKDISSATTTKQIWLKSPSTGTATAHDADFVVDGTDGGIQIITVDGTIDESDASGSNWEIQGYAVLSSGEVCPTRVGEFYVAPNLIEVSP